VPRVEVDGDVVSVVVVVVVVVIVAASVVPFFTATQKILHACKVLINSDL